MFKVLKRLDAIIRKPIIGFKKNLPSRWKPSWLDLLEENPDDADADAGLTSALTLPGDGERPSVRPVWEKDF